MIHTLAVENYRSLRRLVLPLSPLTVVTGANGTGKSSLYRALRLRADAARAGAVAALAREGGLSSTLWAGPEGTVGKGRPVQGTVRTKPVALRSSGGGRCGRFVMAVVLLLALAGCTSLARIGDLKKDIEAEGYEVSGINHNTMNGHDVLTVQAVPGEPASDATADADRIAEIAWTKYPAEIDEIVVVLNGSTALDLGADVLTGKFGERPANLDAGVGGGGRNVTVIVVAVVVAVLLAGLVVFVWLRGRRPRPQPQYRG